MLKDLLIIRLGLCRFCGDHVPSVCVQRARASLWGVSLSSVGHTATGEEMGFPVVQRGLSWQSMKATIKPQTASWYWPARWLIITHLPLICSALFTHYSISTPTPPPPPPDPSLLPPFAHRFSFFVWMWQFVCVCVCVFRSENKCGCEKRKSVCVCVLWELPCMTSKSAELSEKGTLLSPPSQSQHGGGGEEEAPLAASLCTKLRHQLLPECCSKWDWSSGS